MKLSQLRREYEREVIGVSLLEEIRRACQSRARKYPPHIYGKSSSWDEDTIEDLVQDVVVKRLLGEHQIDYLFDVARTVSDWRALLDRQVRITLAGRRVRTVVDNLLDRAKKALRRDDRVRSYRFSRWTVYVLHRSRTDYQPLTDQQARRLAEMVRVIPRQPPGQGERAPIVYAKGKLELLLQVVLQEAPGGITVRDLGRILELVFTDWVPAVLELGEEEPPPVIKSPESIYQVKEVAEGIISKMSKEDMVIMYGRLAGLPDVEIAPQINISRPTLIKRRNLLFNHIRKASEGFGEAEREGMIDTIAIAVMKGKIENGTTT